MRSLVIAAAGLGFLAAPAMAEAQDPVSEEQAVSIAERNGMVRLKDVDREDYGWEVEGWTADGREIEVEINRDGSVSGLRLISSTGGPAFRLAVMEAVEQAGRNRAFGALPEVYQADQLPVSFYFRPAR